MTILRLDRGQSVPWPPSPRGFAQVVELRRTRVRLFYVCKNGRVRQPVVRAAELADRQANEDQPPLPLFNFFGRAAMRGQSKGFKVKV
jgi:hypothetical protein